jgi:hypothetical protein
VDECGLHRLLRASERRQDGRHARADVRSEHDGDAGFQSDQPLSSERRS